MIDWLAIRNFAIAECVEIEFDHGFTTVTGETGSGKSLLADAIAILLGARADNSLIKHGQDQAEIQCSFSLPREHCVFTWLEKNDLSSDQEVLLRRVIRRNKPGRGYINGHPVNFSRLRDIGRELVDIHGQHEHHSLLHRSVQLGLLDEAAGNQSCLIELNNHYQKLSELQRELDSVNNQQVATQERIDLLKFQLLELNQLRPVNGEWEELDQLQKRLHHGKELAVGCQAVAMGLYLDETESVHTLLTKFAGQLRQLEQFDDGLGTITAMVEESCVNVEEAARQLQGHVREEELDQSRIEEIEQRVASYHELSRKHRVQPGLLAEHSGSLQAELSGLSNPEAERDKIAASIDKHRADYDTVSASISVSRKSTADKLANQITAAMQELGMAGGMLEIQLNSLAPGQISRLGNESVEFMVSANPGFPLQPLSRVASGGEISRISLAIQVILAGAAKVPTLIFDEVDVGIGGTVANIVGQRLNQLGQSVQVICVTHLAQVAARANHHFSVLKAEPDSQSGTPDVTVSKLDHENRIEEISRMSGSEKLTTQSRAHAEQMLALG